MSQFATFEDLLQAEPAERWGLDDRIEIGPDAEARPDLWPAWTDTRVGLGPIEPDASERPSPPTRRGFLGGLVGLVAGGIAAPALASRVVSSPLADALARMEAAQVEADQIMGSPDDPDCSYFDCPSDQAMDAATSAECKARKDLVAGIAAAAGLDLATVDSWSLRFEQYQRPFACHREGDRLYLLIADPEGFGCERITPETALSFLLPVVVDLAGVRS